MITKFHHSILITKFVWKVASKILNIVKLQTPLVVYSSIYDDKFLIKLIQFNLSVQKLGLQ